MNQMGKKLKTEMDKLQQRIAEMELSGALLQRVEKAIRTSEERYRLLAENVTDIIWTMDLNLRITYASPSATRMLGYSEKEILSFTLADLFSADSCQIAMRALREELAKENLKNQNFLRSWTLELEQPCKDGSFLWTETRLTFLRDEENKVNGILGVTRDVAERKRMEEQVMQSNLLASLGKMTAGIAHEVNNPLGSILLYSELLLQNSTEEETKRDLKIIHEEARRAAKVMTSLLTYSIGTGSRNEQCELNEIIHNVIEMRQYQQKVQNIKTTARLSRELLNVYGNSSQLIQVVMNIILNAEEALEKVNGGAITVTTRLVKNWAKVTVSDNGPGIPDEYLDQVFFPFFTTKEEGSGIGLGLSTCYGIVTSCGGIIRAETNERGGTSITVEMPVAIRTSRKPDRKYG